MPQEVVDRVHVLACQNQLNPPGLIFGDRTRAPIVDTNPNDTDDNDDLTYTPGNDDYNDDSDDKSNADSDDVSNDGSASDSPIMKKQQ